MRSERKGKKEMTEGVGGKAGERRAREKVNEVREDFGEAGELEAKNYYAHGLSSKKS